MTEPLAPAVAEAMRAAVDEMTTAEGFRGYGPAGGYDFLRHAIAEHDYRARGCDVADDEVFVSDGSKCDCGNLLDLLGPGNAIAVPDPVYPVYVDANVMHGHTGGAGDDGRYAGLTYLEATEANGFAPALPSQSADVIYLCFPNNPTGAVASRRALQQWVDYAREHRALLFFDAAYEAFISDASIPHSIYELDGARECAIELRSFSKTAGFTGTRCAFTIVPKSLNGRTKDGRSVPFHQLWSRRQSTKFGGVGYVVQRGAAAAYSAEGRDQIRGLDRWVHGERRNHQTRPHRRRPDGLRRRERPLRLGQVPARPRQLGPVRPPPSQGRRRLHPRRRLRQVRRGLLPP